MSVDKRKHGIENLQSDPLMMIVLRHARKTSDDVRAMLRNARNRAAKARHGPGVGSASHGQAAMNYKVGEDHRGERFPLLSRQTKQIFAMILGDLTAASTTPRVH
jgi:hypothetical protein